MEEKRFKEQQAAAEKGWSDDDHGNGKVAHLLDDNFQVTNTKSTHSNNKPRAMTFRRHPRPLPCYAMLCYVRYATYRMHTSTASASAAADTAGAGFSQPSKQASDPTDLLFCYLARTHARRTTARRMLLCS